MMQKIKIDISTISVLKILGVLFLLYILFLIRDVLLLIFIVLILVAAFRPVVENWGKKIGRPFSIFLLLLIILGIIIGFIYLIVPPLVNQSKQLILTGPDLVNRFSVIRSHFPAIEKGISALTQSAGQITGSFITITTNVVNGIVAFFTVIILAIYFLLDEKKFTKFAHMVIPERSRDSVMNLFHKISQKVGDWLRGQITLGFIMGITSFVGLSIIGLPYAVALGVITGLLEIVPILGPIISGALAALVAFTISPITAVIVIAFYIILQQLENNFLVPKIMQKAIGLPPAIIIVAILIGTKLLGILGGLLAVPIAGIVYVLAQEWQTVRQITSGDNE